MYLFSDTLEMQCVTHSFTMYYKKQCIDYNVLLVFNVFTLEYNVCTLKAMYRLKRYIARLVTDKVISFIFFNLQF